MKLGLTFASLFLAALLPATPSSESRPEPEEEVLILDEQAKWENAPRVDLVCRTYSEGANILWQIFMPSFLLFWPLKAWKSSGLVVIFDDDSINDHVAGTILNNLQLITPIRVKYETKPPENTTCGNWRREGYSRQQYSNFYVDLYTDAEYAAIVDSDAMFTAPVLVSDLFVDGKPRVRGFDQVSRWTSVLQRRAIGGRQGVGTFMTPFSFPLMVKTSDMAQMREDIARNLGSATFEEAFHTICNDSEDHYSQFDIMFNYLWYYKRDEYFWNIARVENHDFRKITTNRTIPSFYEPASSANIPTMFIMHHSKDDKSAILSNNVYDVLCVGSDFEAGDCSRANHTRAYSTTVKRCTGHWSAENRSWNDTLQNHIEGVRHHSSAFVWRSEVQADKAVVGT